MAPLLQASLHLLGDGIVLAAVAQEDAAHETAGLKGGVVQLGQDSTRFPFEDLLTDEGGVCSV